MTLTNSNLFSLVEKALEAEPDNEFVTLRRGILQQLLGVAQKKRDQTENVVDSNCDAAIKLMIEHGKRLKATDNADLSVVSEPERAARASRARLEEVCRLMASRKRKKHGDDDL